MRECDSMKKELLAPAGDFETLKQAVHNGADAIYLGGKRFGARKFASNFDNEEMIAAIKYCHLYGVKIYVTANTVIYEDEVNDYLNYIKFLHENGVDAVIMQDIGMITLVRKVLPNLDVHVSTQAHTHNLEQIKLLEDTGLYNKAVTDSYDYWYLTPDTHNIFVDSWTNLAKCTTAEEKTNIKEILKNKL